MYRRSNAWATPNYGPNARKSSVPAQPASSAKIFRATSQFDVRPSSVYRGPRASSAERKMSVGNSQSTGRYSTSYATNRPQVTKDPRPISDKNYQTSLVQKILEFCHNNGYECLTEKQLRTPCRQDFVGLFTFLYRFIDEGYEYDNSRPIEVEFLELVRPLGYPVQLNASTLKTFNAPHAWPTVLAAVYWLMELVQFGMEWSFERVLFPLSESDFLSPQGDRNREPKAWVVYQYYCEYFKLLQAGSDNFSEIDQNLADMLGVDEDIAAKIEEKTTEQDQLKEELAELETRLSEIDVIQKSVSMKKREIGQLDDYLRKMENYVVTRSRALEEMNAEKRAADEKVTGLKEGVKRKKLLITKQPIKPADVELMHSKKEELKKRIAAFSDEMQQAEKITGQNQMHIAGKKEMLEAKANEFMTKANRLLHAIPSMRSKVGEFTDVSPFAPTFLENAHQDILPWIKTAKTVLMDEREAVANSVTDSRDQIACLNEQLDELRLEEDALQGKIKQIDDDLRSYESSTNTEYKDLRKEYDSMEREYENATRALSALIEERTTKEKLSTELNKELEDKRTYYTEKEEESEKALKKTMELMTRHAKELSEMKKRTEEKLEKANESLEQTGLP